MIEVKHVFKEFSGHLVLNDICTDFEPGKTNLTIGQSGSGKTVLLKCIAGLHSVSKGDILYDGRSFSNMDEKQRKEIRKEMGMVFQGGALFDSNTVEENVMFPLEMFTNMSFEERRERANFCLKRVNITNANDKYPSEISGGMQKRVAIARAIALNPKYLYCDEPNSGLDPVTSIVIDNLIKEITIEYNITTIVNTHDMNSVMEIGDKIIFIYKGRKFWQGDSSGIFDTGIGISEEYLPHIFESFTREESTKINRVQGTGLGLAITAKVVEMMKGTISVKSVLGEGSEFTVDLDLESMEEETPEVREEEESVSLEGRRILLVEDNIVNAEIATVILEQFGVKVDVAENGKTGYETVRDAGPGAYDAVLMDIQMPVMNGYESARAIRTLEGDYFAALPVIAMSANAYDEDVKDCLAAGMNAHIAKPFQPEALVKLLCSYIHSGKKEE